MTSTTDDLVLRARRRRIARALAARPAPRWRIGRLGDDGPGQPRRRWASRQMHHLGALASHAWAAAVVSIVALGWVAYGASTGWPRWWQSSLAATTSLVTVVLLFVLQHLQARDQVATQRKLDEILRSLPHADNRLIALEEAPDEELEVLTELNRQDRLG